jgi:predicted nucleic acid-binding protein
MRAFADTNWLEALYFKPDPQDRKAIARDAIVQRRMRKQSGPLLVSHVVLLESRNVFGRVAGSPHPQEWEDLLSDFNGRIFVDSMNWDALRQETNRLFERYRHKTTDGTFDATLLASAQLAGAREFLSFDEPLKAIAAALELKVFPELGPEGKALLGRLRSS